MKKKFGEKNGKIPLLSFFILVEHPEDDWKVHTTIIKNIFSSAIYDFHLFCCLALNLFREFFLFHSIQSWTTWARERGRKCYIESTMVVWGNEKKRQQNVNKLMQPHRHPPATLPRICGVNLTSPLKKMKTFSVNDGSEIYNNGVGWWRDVLLFFPRLSTISTLVDDQSSSGWWWWEGVQHITVRLQNFFKN